MYVGGKDVLPGWHENKTIALLMSGQEFDNDTLGKQYYFQNWMAEHTVASITSVAWCEDTNECHVMLQAKDS